MNNILVPRYLCIGDSKRHDLPPCFAHARAHWIFINTAWSLHVPTIQIHRHAESSHPGKCDSIGFPPCWNSILFENSLLEYKYSSFSAKSISLLPNNQPNIPHLLPIPNNIPNLKNQTSLEHTTTQEQKKCATGMNSNLFAATRNINSSATATSRAPIPTTNVSVSRSSKTLGYKT